MRPIVIGIALFAALPGLSAAQDARNLTAPEKRLIRQSIAVRVLDPEALTFIWLPLIPKHRPDGLIDYCGFINGRNANGGKVGWQGFYAQLRAARAGQIEAADLRLIASDERNRTAVRELCTQFGYSRFAGRPQ